MDFLFQHMYGVLGLGLWGYVLASFLMIELTILSVTLYLHRDQTHRGLDLHPALRHFFRFWLWLTTGMGTKDWVAVHRKHHAHCETEADPHSPKIYGLKRVLLEGAELYKAEAADPETLAKYGRGTPEDWLERNLYRAHSFLGIFIMVISFLVLFGVPGIIMIAVQLVSIPLFAAGVINGIGHHTGYRNYECNDAATNVVPWGVILGGEELHNNHHAFPSSAKFSARPWEFDVGWFFISILSALGLAKVKKVAPRPVVVPRRTVDLDTLRAVIVNRMHVLRDYTRTVTLPVFRSELAGAAGGDNGFLRRAKKLLIRQPVLLDESGKARLSEVLAGHQSLQTVYEFRERLQRLWDGANVSNDRLLAQLKEWCAQAEESGIKVLADFAQVLRGYSLEPARG